MPPILNKDFIRAGLNIGLADNLLISAFAFAISASNSSSLKMFTSFGIISFCCGSAFFFFLPIKESRAFFARSPSKRCCCPFIAGSFFSLSNISLIAFNWLKDILFRASSFIRDSGLSLKADVAAFVVFSFAFAICAS